MLEPLQYPDPVMLRVICARDAVNKHIESLRIKPEALPFVQISKVTRDEDTLTYITASGQYALISCVAPYDCEPSLTYPVMSINSAQGHGLIPDQMICDLIEAEEALREASEAERGRSQLYNAVHILGLEKAQEIINEQRGSNEL
jgi:hypothetical protein